MTPFHLGNSRRSHCFRNSFGVAVHWQFQQMFNAVEPVRSPQIEVICSVSQVKIEKLARSSPAIFGQKLGKRRGGPINRATEFGGVTEAPEIEPVEKSSDVLDIALADHSS
jgi:hypothetical protein